MNNLQKIKKIFGLNWLINFMEFLKLQLKEDYSISTILYKSKMLKLAWIFSGRILFNPFFPEQEGPSYEFPPDIYLEKYNSTVEFTRIVT
jgi:hypothetical protein